MVGPPDLSLTIGGVRLKNPVMSASGTFGYGRELEEFVDPTRLGAVVTKGISLEPRSGNPPPRIVETPAGLINAIGLQNVGLKGFVEKKLPWLREKGALVVANILGESIEEYAAIAAGLEKAQGVALIEINVSCPNVAAGGLAFGTDPEGTAAVVRAVRAETGLPVMVKLTPMVTDITTVAQASAEAGASALSLINTIPALAVDLSRRRPALANVVGGLSGPAIKPVALRLVWLAAKAVNIPVVGIGGIMNARDALEFLLVGARAVQVGTANFINPRTTISVIEGIELYFSEHGLTGLDDLVGQLDTSPSR